jgi:hypothetical protein
MIVLISSNRLGMVGVDLGELGKGENELSKKKLLIAIQITIELVAFWGIRTGMSWSYDGICWYMKAYDGYIHTIPHYFFILGDNFLMFEYASIHNTCKLHVMLDS